MRIILKLYIAPYRLNFRQTISFPIEFKVTIANCSFDCFVHYYRKPTVFNRMTVLLGEEFMFDKITVY